MQLKKQILKPIVYHLLNSFPNLGSFIIECVSLKWQGNILYDGRLNDIKSRAIKTSSKMDIFYYIIGFLRDMEIILFGLLRERSGKWVLIICLCHFGEDNIPVKQEVAFFFSAGWAKFWKATLPPWASITGEKNCGRPGEPGFKSDLTKWGFLLQSNQMVHIGGMILSFIWVSDIVMRINWRGR